MCLVVSLLNDKALQAWVSMGMVHNAEGKRTSLMAKIFF